MKIGELFDMLKEGLDNGALQRDWQVMLQKDQEGNGFEEARGLESNLSWRNQDYENEVKYTVLTPELDEQGYGEDDAIYPEDTNWEDCILIYP